MRANQTKLWLAVLLLTFSTSTNGTRIKQRNDTKDNETDLKTNDKNGDNFLANDRNSFLFGKNINQNKNESNSEDYSQANKENESNLKNTYMAICGKISIANGNKTCNIENKDASDINNVQVKEEIRHAIRSDIYNKTGDQGKNTTLNNNESRYFQRKIDDKFKSVENTDRDFDVTHNVNKKIKRKRHNVTESKNITEKIIVEPRDITNAIDFGVQALEELVKIKEPRLYRLGLFLDKDHPAARVANFGAPTSQKAILMSRVGYATLEASKKIAENYPKNVWRQSVGIPNDLQSRIDLEACTLRELPRCPPASGRFRTSDGTCNNLEHPWRGAAVLPMQRFLPPVYEDGIQSVRRSIFDEPLPSAREISTVIHRDRNREIQSVTMMFTQWGQFIDHDITSTVKARSFNGSIPRCCDAGGGGMLPPDLLHPSCLPIEVPRTDPFLSRFGIECMEFIRSAPSTRIDCELGWREQINQVTPYIDASTIYGSDVDTSDSIRMFRNGQIIYGRPQNQGPLNPPDPPDAELCRAGALSEECLQPGDGRVSENPGLIALHTIFVRYHNKVASVLSKTNTHWSDERVYQETRKIVSSVIQHITYREYLPIVLGPEVMDIFELRVLKKGYFNKYDNRIIPAIANSFGTAAFRFGHSMIQNSFIRTDSHHIPLPKNVSLHEEISNFNNIWTFGSVDRILLGFSNQPSQRRDEFMADELTNHLFQFSDATPFGMDLAAINIQRGRDHGIPPYTSWRKPCGLSPVKNWRDLEKIMSINSVIRLKTLYLHVDDIDLFTGGLAEKPLRGGVVGPTFACIIAQQFSNLKKGDRFWYENDGFESSFSPAQLQQIRKVSLAQVICQTTDEVETIQPFLFLSADKTRNIRVSCDSPEITNFDLGAWTERPFELNVMFENGDPFEQEGSQNDNLNLIRRRRVINRLGLNSQTTKNGTKTKYATERRKSIYNINKHISNNPFNISIHRRDTRSAKRNTTTTPTKPLINRTHKSKTQKNNSIIRKIPKNRVSTLKPIQITSVPFKVKFGDVPKKPNFAAHTTTRPIKKKPQYYQIQDLNHDDVTYLFGILPKHTTITPIQMNPIQVNQVNININYPSRSTTTSSTITTPTKKKKRPNVTTSSNNLSTNGYASRPVITGTHKPTDLYGQSNVLTTKKYSASTKRPSTLRTTSISYPMFIYNPTNEGHSNNEPTTKNPTYFLDTNGNYGKPNDFPHRPMKVKPSTEYYADHYDNNDQHISVDANPGNTYQYNDNYNNHAYGIGFTKKPLYISTSDYINGHYSNRPAVYESKPFSTSNFSTLNKRRHTNTSTSNADKYLNKIPTNNYYFANDNNNDVRITPKDKRRPESTLDNIDETYFNDHILNGFFNDRHDKTDNYKSNGGTKLKVNVDGKLDFKSRVVYRKADQRESDKDNFVNIATVKKEEIFEKEQERTGEFHGKLRPKRRSMNKIRIVNVDVMPSESRNEWKYFNDTEESTNYMEVPELPVNMPCSYEVPKPMIFIPSNGDDA